MTEKDMCDGCGSYLNNEGHKTPRPIGNKEREEEMTLCDFCFGSLLGNMMIYPSQYQEQHTMARGLLECFNILQKQIQEKENGSN